ncbi:MAG: tRNA adenosine(34) deaminase TadA [Spirochaetota bacterium]
MNTHELYMNIAIQQAMQGAYNSEIPIGAVIVKDDEIIAQAYNKNRQSQDPTAHAEILAIRQAAKILLNERLTGCIMYVTKEPCAMCAGAIVHARIEKLYIGTRDYRFGACGTVLPICGNETLNHVPDIVFGIMEEECKKVLQDFFVELRNKK